MERKSNIFILNGSVNSKHAHPPPSGLCRTFVILFWKSCKCPMVGLNVHTKPPQWGLKIDMERKPNIFILNGSVNSKHAHPSPPSRHLSDICHFVLEKLQMPHGGAERSYKTPTVGLKNRVQMPHPGITPKLNFQLISCKYHIYGNSLITC